jgi:hypothetical protein
VAGTSGATDDVVAAETAAAVASGVAAALVLTRLSAESEPEGGWGVLLSLSFTMFSFLNWHTLGSTDITHFTSSQG